MTMKKSTKRVLLIVAALALLLGIMGAAAVHSLNASLKQVEALEIAHADASHMPDGMYIGECDMGVLFAKVEVTVQDGRIAQIELLEHRHGLGKAAEEIISVVIARQRVDIDAIAGATLSSRVILKAVDNALITAGD